MSRTGRAALAVFLLALLVRGLHVAEFESKLGLDLSRIPDSESWLTGTWAERIADGDLLSRTPPRAFPTWRLAVAPASRWLEWYRHSSTPPGSPLYAYALAAAVRLVGATPWAAHALNALLGALTCALLVLLGSRLASARVGLWAGLLLALSGPVIYHDVFPQRTGLLLLGVVVVTLALERALRRGGLASWLLLGASLGLFTLMCETGPALAALALLGLAGACVRRVGPGWPALAALGLGFALLLSPWVARNISLGTGPWPRTARGPEAFVVGNARGQPGVGWAVPTRDMRDVLMDSNFRFLPAVGQTLATHRAAPEAWLGLVLFRLRALFHGTELNRQLPYQEQRARLLSLRASPVSATLLVPLAALGVLVGLRRRRQLLAAYLALLAFSAAAACVSVEAHTRLPLYPLLALFAAVSLDRVLRALADRRYPALLMALLVGLWLTHAVWPSDSGRGPWAGEADLLVKLARTNQLATGLALAEPLRAQVPPGPPRSPELNSALEGYSSFRRIDLSTDDVERALLRGHGYVALLPAARGSDELTHLTALARDAFEQARRLDPLAPGVSFGLGRVEYVLQTQVLRQGQFRLGTALGWFMKELRRDPDHAASHWHCALIRLVRGDDREALEHFLNAERCGMVDAEVFAGIARISCDLRLARVAPVQVGGETLPVVDVPRALAYAQRALELAPANPTVLEIGATAAFHNDLLPEAASLLEELLVIVPQRAGDLQPRIDALKQAHANGSVLPAELEPELDPLTEDEPGSALDVGAGQGEDVDPAGLTPPEDDGSGDNEH